MCCYLPDEAESVVHAFSGRIHQYIFTSTVDVYTKPAAHYPITEQAERKPSPTFAYAYHKAECEEILHAAYNDSDFLVTIIRPAYTYGESRGILHSLGGRTTYIDRIRKGKPIIVHNDGQSLWSSCHIDDVARAFVNAIGNPKSYGQAYHVTGEEVLTWDQYHQQVAAALGAPAPTLVHIPATLLANAVPKLGAWAEMNFQYSNAFYNSAAHRDLHFRYTIPWQQGVQRTVAWLDARGRVENSDDEPEYDRIIAAWQQHGEGMVEALADLR
jgi:nucleoside-diphosphate-sugar epimerase